MDTDSIASVKSSTLHHEFITQVYAWMSSGLAVTALVSWVLAKNYELTLTLVTNHLLFYGLLIGEILLVIAITAGISRMSATTATLLFFLYAALNGITLSVIFLAYSGSTVSLAFIISGAMFAVMSSYGYITKTDLTHVGNLAFMGLLGIIIASLANLFFHNSMADWIISYVGVLVFVGLTAYDTQKIKTMALVQGIEAQNKAAVLGALTLYLDFINLFLVVLRILGGRRK